MNVRPVVLPRPVNQRERDLVMELDRAISDISKILNGGILFSDNVSAKLVTFTSSGTPDAENTVAHTIGRIPVGFIVYSIDKAAIVYAGTTAWTSTNIYLKVNVATVAVKILVF